LAEPSLCGAAAPALDVAAAAATTIATVETTESDARALVILIRAILPTQRERVSDRSIASPRVQGATSARRGRDVPVNLLAQRIIRFLSGY
jgi:hypothetical protein